MKQNINKSQGYRKHQSILYIYRYILRGVGDISMFSLYSKELSVLEKSKKGNFDNSCSVEKAL